MWSAEAASAFLYQPQHRARTTPRHGEARAAVAVVVNDGTAVAQLAALDPDACFSERAETNTLGEDTRFVDVKHSAAFSDNSRSGCGISGEIGAEFIRSTKNAIVRTWDCVH